MNYLIFQTNKLIKHITSGTAHNKQDKLEKRILDCTVILILYKGDYHVKCIEEYYLKKNDILILPEGIEHYGVTPSLCELHWHHVCLPKPTVICEYHEIQKYINEDSIVLPMKFHIEKMDIINILSYQLEQYNCGNIDTENIRNALMTSIIYALEHDIKEKNTDFYPQRFNSILNYINHNFQHHPISIKILSDEFKYSEKYIYRLFKKYLGISPKQYIIKKKLNEAKNMVLNDNCTVEQIASILNYESTNYFLKQFKQEFGITPTNMRKLFSKTSELYLKKE